MFLNILLEINMYYLLLQAFQKLDKEKKKQDLEKMREKYGIGKDKWTQPTFTVKPFYSINNKQPKRSILENVFKFLQKDFVNKNI